ncbi:MAG: Dabb family protein [Clostridiaceae bacterium]|nr:Dabb family protein [Clostridiaceae bacterium]
MIKHIVMWKLKDFAQGCTREENAQKIKSMLEALTMKIEQIKYLEVGINVNKSNMAFDAVLISEFEDEQKLEEYRKHPEHVKVSEFVSKVRDDRRVVDYYFEPAE